MHTAHTAATFANVMAALSTGLFIIFACRLIAHLIRNQPLSRRLTRRALSDTIELLATKLRIAALILVAISLAATFISAGDTSTALRQSLICTVLVVLCMVINGLVRHTRKNHNAVTNVTPCIPSALKVFVYTLVHPQCGWCH